MIPVGSMPRCQEKVRRKILNNSSRIVELLNKNP